MSNPCLRDDHEKCPGRVALPYLVNGKRFTRCRCETCAHPAIQVMPIKD